MLDSCPARHPLYWWEIERDDVKASKQDAVQGAGGCHEIGSACGGKDCGNRRCRRRQGAGPAKRMMTVSASRAKCLAGGALSSPFRLRLSINCRWRALEA